MFSHHPRSGPSVLGHKRFTGTGSAKQGYGEGWETALSKDLKNAVHRRQNTTVSELAIQGGLRGQGFEGFEASEGF